MAFLELKREGMGPQRGWDTCCQSHSKWGRRTGALDFVATENLSVHQRGGEGWVESGLRPGGLLCGGRGSRDKPCWGLEKSGVLVSVLALGYLGGSKEV